ncbi:hypothetical protein L249_7686 [Ophiocordyceps polyrhachis-furcata BCC 54312]|uniref:Uncharacterized protein n=1 Tax=Ophiocordyceps polyrhachis-furcata BCC 54312 TaxID=1330021 RepID=A0A367LAG3_9HYPO|nr:hypothetical protein L249_7686 [Ophiocordyceps polyrhachis-furcata BCC 54312]
MSKGEKKRERERVEGDAGWTRLESSVSAMREMKGKESKEKNGERAHVMRKGHHYQGLFCSVSGSWWGHGDEVRRLGSCFRRGCVACNACNGPVPSLPDGWRRGGDARPLKQ